MNSHTTDDSRGAEGELPLLRAMALTVLVGTIVVFIVLTILPAANRTYPYVVLLLPLAVLWHESWLFRSKGAMVAALLKSHSVASVGRRMPPPEVES